MSWRDVFSLVEVEWLDENRFNLDADERAVIETVDDVRAVLKSCGRSHGEAGLVFFEAVGRAAEYVAGRFGVPVGEVIGAAWVLSSNRAAKLLRHWRLRGARGVVMQVRGLLMDGKRSPDAFGDFRHRGVEVPVGGVTEVARAAGVGV